MFDSASARSARTLLALTAAATVGLTGLAGAAQADHDHDEYDEYKSVDVTVCKKVVDRDDHDDHGYDHNRPVRFDFTARVNGHFHDDFSLTGKGGKRCFTFEVDRGDRVRVREHRTPGYELRDIRVTGARSVNTNASSTTFKAHTADINVRFVNVKKHDRY